MIYETYAKRQRAAAKSGQPDVYTYDSLPAFLRKQLGIIFTDTLGRYIRNWDPYATSMPECGNKYWDGLADILRKEIEAFDTYREEGSKDVSKHCLAFLQGHSNIDEVLSLVELFCVQISILATNRVPPKNHGATQDPRSALSEINSRLREHAVGFQFENEKIIRVDSQYVHAEVTKPALGLLSEPRFAKANDEFMAAHQHYRVPGEQKAAITAALRAFESTLKAICEAKNWPYESGARAADLVKICRKNGLFPAYLDNGLDTYVAMIKTGLPELRNNAGGHGAAPKEPEVPRYLAAYAIHLTASNIVLAVNAFKELP